MPAPIDIVLMMEHEATFARRLWRGVMSYLQPAKHWSLNFISPHGRLPARPSGIIASIDSHEQRARLRRAGVPVVAITASTHNDGFPEVTVDDHAIGRCGAAHFLEQGFTRLGFVSMPAYAWSQRRQRGFVAAIAAAGLGCEVFDVREWLADPAARRARGLAARLRGLEKPTALMAVNDWTAWRTFDLCRRQGVRIPDEVALLGADDDQVVCEALVPAASSMALPWEQVGYRAATLLEGLMGGARPPDDPILLPPGGVTVRDSSTHAARLDDDVIAALRFIHQHADRPINVADILDGIHVSRRSLERKFRRLVGRSPLDELYRIRIEQAKHLLRRSALPMAEIARRAGFASAKRFSTIFRARTGSSPSGFRARRGP